MNYEEAKSALGSEKKVTRPSFGEGAFIFHALPFANIYFEGEDGVAASANASAYFNVPYKSGGVLCKKTDVIEVGWNPTKEDVMADDWDIVEQA